MQRKMFLMLTISLLALMFSTAALAQQKFIGHLNAIQEVPPSSSTGNGICTVTLNSAETQITVVTTFSGLTSAANAGHIHDAGPVGVNGPVRFPFTGVSGTSGTLGPFTFAVTAQQVADLRAKKWYCNIHTANFPGGEIRGQVKPTNTVFDLDGDGRTDITVFRQSANAFYTLSSVNNSLIYNSFGSGTGDNWLNSTGDFDGDGRGDPVILKINQTTGGGFWSVLQSGNNTIRTVEVGSFFTTNVERLVPGDYDGDGKEDPAVFRGGNGFWYILQSSTNTLRIVPNFGAVNDIPSVGDFDKDSKTDLTVIRNEGGQLAWYTLLSTTGQSVRTVWGSPTDGITFFAKIDVDGDGAQDRMTTRTVNGLTQFNILRSSDNGQVYLTWGIGGAAATADAKLYGDYDGDGKTDFVARRVVGGQLIWYILQSSTNYDPAQARAVQWGITGDQ